MADDKELELTPIESLQPLESDASMRDIVTRLSEINNTNKILASNLQNILYSKGLDVPDTRLSKMILQVNDQLGIDLSTELDSVQERLQSLVTNTGYELDGTEDTDTLFNILTPLITKSSYIKQISCGQSTSVIVTTDGNLYGTGYNGYGQLGSNSTSNASEFYQSSSISGVVQAATGNYHTLAVCSDGYVFSCGGNNCYALGLGSVSKKTTFQCVQIYDGANTSYFTGGVKAAVGYDHSMILKNDNTVWGAGSGEYGSTGLDTTYNTSWFKQLSNSENAIDVACGWYHTVVLKNDGTVWTCGHNDFGQLGLGDTTSRYTLAQVPNLTDVKQISCGDYHTFVLKNDGTIWACGHNDSGQLGLSDNTNRNTFTQITGISDVKQVICGPYYTYIIKNDGTVYASGTSSYGVLNNIENSVNVFTQITGIPHDIKSISCGGYQVIYTTKNSKSFWGCGYGGSNGLGFGSSGSTYDFTETPLL